ncbi:hypothetical protein AVEN_207981-1, partial [Araneus ventricosus]
MAIQNSNLLPSFINEVVKIVEDETIVRSNLKSVSDVYSWIEEYGRTSDTKWNLLDHLERGLCAGKTLTHNALNIKVEDPGRVQTVTKASLHACSLYCATNDSKVPQVVKINNIQ